MENTHTNIEPITMQEMHKAFMEAVALVSDYPKKIHMTTNFLNRLIANPSTEVKKSESILTLLGIPVEIHTEPCEKEYWFDYQDKIKNYVYGWHYDEFQGNLYKQELIKWKQYALELDRELQTGESHVKIQG